MNHFETWEDWSQCADEETCYAKDLKRSRERDCDSKCCKKDKKAMEQNEECEPECEWNVRKDPVFFCCLLANNQVLASN